MRALFRELPVQQPADVAVVRHVAGQMAAEQSFPVQRQAEVRLMASELAQNHLDHKTKSGRVRVSSLIIDQVPSLTLTALDEGPGIADVSSILDGETGRHRSKTGLGAGLASIRRLADSFSICSGSCCDYPCPGFQAGEQGTIITGCCWLDYQPPPVLTVLKVDCVGIVSSRSENMPCGDGLFVDGDDRFLRIVLVDSPGIGSGFRLTRKVKERLQDMDMIWPPDQLFEQLSFALAAGIAIEILRFDHLRKEVQCAGVGNVGAWLVVDGKLVRTVDWRPTGHPNYNNRIQLFSYPVQEHVFCLLHSDGIQPFTRGEIEALLSVGLRPQLFPTSSLVLQSAFSMNRLQQDDAAICVWQWQKQ